MQIKQSYKGENGNECLYVNIEYPIFESKNTVSLNALLKQTAESYLRYAEKKVLPLSLKSQTPFSAVMKCKVAENDKTVAVTICAFVFDGQKRVPAKEKTVYFDKQNGFLKGKII